MRRAFAGTLMLLALAAGFVFGRLGDAPETAALIVLAGAIVLGEAFELRPPGRDPIAMSYAVFLVLAREGTAWQVAATVVVAELVAALTRPGSPLTRVGVFVWRCAVAGAAVVTFRVVAESTGATNTIELLLALAAACLAMLVVHEIGTAIAHRRIAVSIQGRSADVALVTSGSLMALGYGGVDGKGELGLWALLLFAIPLVATWYSFERLASARETYWQTIHALSLAPELGGVVHSGHAERVARLALDIGRQMDLAFPELETLEAAAYLHHIGDLCVDVVPRDAAFSDPDPFEAVDLSVRILRDTGHLAPVAEVVEAVPVTYRSPGSGRPTAGGVAGQILKVASAFDELAVREGKGSNRALAVMFSSPAYVYDPRVLSELEHLLHRQGEAVPDD